MNQLRQPDKPICIKYLLKNKMVSIEKESSVSLIEMEKYEIGTVLLKSRKDNTCYKNKANEKHKTQT